MGLDNPLHIAFLLILLLLVFGAKRLPEMGRSLGSGMRGFKESLGGEHAPTALSAHEPAPGAAPAVHAAPVREGAPRQQPLAVHEPVAVHEPLASGPARQSAPLA